MNIDKILEETISLGSVNMAVEAKKYIDMKLSIIPVGKNKVPLIPWKEFSERIATHEEVDAWFEKYPDAQLGMVTGKISGITVVDVEADGGEAEWNKLPQNCPIVKTGGGGRHYWFLYTEKIKNGVRVKGLMNNTDIRNNGGYVILPPSSSDKGSYEWVQQIPPCQFPSHLFGSSTVDIFNVVKSNNVINKSQYSSLLDIYQGSGEGGRNDSMAKFIGYILTKIHPDDWERHAWQITMDANTKNNPPLGDYELRRTFDSIRQTEKNNSPDRFSNKPENDYDSCDEEDDVRLLSEVAKAEMINLSNPYPIGVDIFDNEVRGGLFPGDLVIVAAMPSHGKTSFSQFIAYNFVKKNNEKVLFLSYEVLMQFVWEKFQNMGMADNDTLYAPFKHTTGNLKWVEKKIKEAKEKYGVKLVVIDHLGYLESGKSRSRESYSLELTFIAKELKRIAKSEEVMILTPVHVRKRSSGEKKGINNLDIEDIAHSGGISQEADLVFIMKREENNNAEDVTLDIFTNYTLISLAKNRRGSRNPRAFFTMMKDLYVRDDNYKGLNSENLGSYKRPINPSKTREEIEKDLENDYNKNVLNSIMFGIKD